MYWWSIIGVLHTVGLLLSTKTIEQSTRIENRMVKAAWRLLGSALNDVVIVNYQTIYILHQSGNTNKLRDTGRISLYFLTCCHPKLFCLMLMD